MPWDIKSHFASQKFWASRYIIIFPRLFVHRYLFFASIWQRFSNSLFYLMLFYSVIVKKKLTTKKKIVFKGDVWPDALSKEFHTLKKSQQQSVMHMTTISCIPKLHNVVANQSLVDSPFYYLCQLQSLCATPTIKHFENFPSVFGAYLLTPSVGYPSYKTGVILWYIFAWYLTMGGGS